MHVFKLKIKDISQVNLEITGNSDIPHTRTKSPGWIVQIAIIDGLVLVYIFKENFETVKETFYLGCFICAFRYGIGVLLKTDHHSVEVEIRSFF